MSSRGGESGWMAATNALGLGVDDPNVRLVVHAGMPRQMVDFVQESGRGGRDGQKSESVVCIRQSWLEQQREKRDKQEGYGWQQRQEWDWDKDVIEFVDGNRCRREVLDREMDGNIDRFGCEEDEEMCDVCWEQQRARDVDDAGVELRFAAEERADDMVEQEEEGGGGGG
jgi:superfamily II DNA helicase RecQ